MGIGLRPHFELELACSSRDAVERLCTHLGTTPLVMKRTRVPGGGQERGPRDHEHVTITVPAGERHFWSPWLTVELSPRDAGTHVVAQFSPHPSVWTGFAFGYLTLGVTCAVMLTIGASGLMLEDSGQGWAFWAAAITALALVGLWIAAQLGQRLARAQMEGLRKELDLAIETCRAR